MNLASANRTRELEVSLSAAESAAFDGLRSLAERQLATRLAAELATGPASVRLRAAARLVDVAGILALPSLIAVLDELAGTARAELVTQLGRTASVHPGTAGQGERASLAAAYEVARRLQGDRDAWVRAAAVEAAVRLGASDAAAMRGALLEGLDDEDPRVRRRAALCAASTRGLDPGELLLPLVEDPDRQCRRLAVVALGSTTAPEAVDALLLALLDDDRAVRAAAEASAQRLFGEDAAGLDALADLQRDRAVARLRAQLAANRARGRLVSEPRRRRPLPDGAESREVHAAVAELVTNSVLDQLLADDGPDAGEPEAAALGTARAPERRGDAGLVDDDIALDADAVGVADDVAPTGIGEGAALTAGGAEVEAGGAFADEMGMDEGADTSSPRTSELGFRAIEAILRAALRGVDDATLAAELGFSPLALGPVLEEHLESGRIIRRGKKLFLP